jgi:hypothetical protein
MPAIENKDFWDLRDLASLAEECRDVLDPENEPDTYDDDERQEARETLVKLSGLAADLNQENDETDGDSVSEALNDAMGYYGPTLMSEDYFPSYVQEFVTDCGYLPDNLPSFIASNIDWDGVADDMKQDFTSVTFDGEDWYIR